MTLEGFRKTPRSFLRYEQYHGNVWGGLDGLSVNLNYFGLHDANLPQSEC